MIRPRWWTCRTLALLTLAAACGGSPQQPQATPHTDFIDPDGLALTLPDLPARRIVSTMQSATEWVVILGATDHLVARTDFDRQPELAELPSIGGGLDPSPEVVASLTPDLVLGWQNRASRDLATALRPLGIPILALETNDTSDMFRHLHSLGAVTGKTARADSLATSLRAELQQLRSECPATPPERVMLVLWSDPPMTTGPGTWVATLLETACFANVFDDIGMPWPTVSLEAILDRQPDWLLTSSGAPGQRLADFRQRPGWRDLAAVRAGRILEIPGDLLARPGPMLPAAVRALREARLGFAN